MSVQISLTGLSFLVKNTDSNETHFFTENKFDGTRSPEEIELEIDTILSETDALQLPFTEVTLIYTNTIYTTVPASLFDESKASEYLKFNSKILANDFIAFDTVETQDLVVVYIPFVNINNYFFDRFGSFQYFHGTSIFLKKILSAEKYSIVSKFYMHVQEDQFDCISIKNGALQLCNTYSYKTPEDFIYYTLFCLEQLKLNPDSLSVFICGEIDENDANYKMLYTYIRNISFLKTESDLVIDGASQTTHKKFIIKNAL
ncbi:DUF3822 family protein [Ulvibacter litoralis]|uniref:DUF3822 family protein n=1 Tax=Ulvibacter litoralis TaxID=227084 RepID=UPI001586ACE1|nr:DUF3822 family protein [Ulvibacter litoralis]